LIGITRILFGIALFAALSSCATTASQPNFVDLSNSLPKVNESLFDAENDPVIVGIGVGLLKLEKGCIYFHSAVNPRFMKDIDDEGLAELRSQYGELKVEKGLTMTDEKFVVIWPEDTITIQKAELIEIFREKSPNNVAKLNVPIKLMGGAHSKPLLRQFKKYLHSSPKNFCNLSAPVVNPSAWDIFRLNQ